MRNLLIISLLVFLPAWDSGFSKSRKARTAEKKFEKIFQDYRTKKNSGKKTWYLLNRIEKKYRTDLDNTNVMRLIAFKAQLLHHAGFPILSSIYASESILFARHPFSKESTVAWRILKESSADKPIEYLIDRIALKFMNSDMSPKAFGNDWNYHIGTALMNKGKNKTALGYFKKLNMQDRYFIPAQYQLAMGFVEAGKYSEAESLLKAILTHIPRSSSSLEDEDKKQMSNYAHLALARMYYEQGKFLSSATQYRKIRKENFLFYDALFEQSWALFMAGRPKHALGSLYGAHSPYFKDYYNPESKILESMVYFWMCRYDEARNALADFAEQHAEAVEGLDSFLDRQRLTPEASYQVFENLISDVSSGALGISRKVLQTAAERDSMLLIRSQYASVLEEYDRLKVEGVFGVRQDIDAQEQRLQSLANNIRLELGGIYLGELNYLNDHFEDLYTQAQFLYLELLMGQKEHLLGRELHADSKVRQIGDVKKLKTGVKKPKVGRITSLSFGGMRLGFKLSMSSHCAMNSTIGEFCYGF